MQIKTEQFYTDDYVHEKLHAALGIIVTANKLTDNQLKFATDIVKLMIEWIIRPKRVIDQIACSKEDLKAIDEVMESFKKERQISPEQLFRRMTK